MHDHLCCEPIYTKNYLLFLDELKALLCQTLLARKHFKFLKNTNLTGLWRNPTGKDRVNEHKLQHNKSFHVCYQMPALCMVILMHFNLETFKRAASVGSFAQVF